MKLNAAANLKVKLVYKNSAKPKPQTNTLAQHFKKNGAENA